VRSIVFGLLLLASWVAPVGAERAGTDALDEARFEIVQDGRRVGREEFVYYASRDTVYSMSTVTLDGLGTDSSLPFEKRTTLLQRRLDAFPMLFEVVSTARDTSLRATVSCVFRDTTVMVYAESAQRGTGDGYPLPPGRIYVIEPGVYLPLQILMADFLEGAQRERKQNAFIPAAREFVDLRLTRGAKQTIKVGRRTVQTTRVDLTDTRVNLAGWLDKNGRLWRLEALGQGLRVERRPLAAGERTSLPEIPRPAKTP
jgi:hypothetical protein